MDVNLWANISAIISAIADVTLLGAEYVKAYEYRKALPNNAEHARLLAAVYSTYSDDEIKAIEKRIQNCRDRFIKEGAGPERGVCFCSVLSDVKEGNGGSIPVPDWERLYDQLKCG